VGKAVVSLFKRMPNAERAGLDARVAGIENLDCERRGGLVSDRRLLGPATCLRRQLGPVSCSSSLVCSSVRTARRGNMLRDIIGAGAGAGRELGVGRIGAGGRRKYLARLFMIVNGINKDYSIHLRDGFERSLGPVCL
jgi:hypothetical protein